MSYVSLWPASCHMCHYDPCYPSHWVTVTRVMPYVSLWPVSCHTCHCDPCYTIRVTVVTVTRVIRFTVTRVIPYESLWPVLCASSFTNHKYKRRSTVRPISLQILQYLSTFSLGHERMIRRCKFASRLSMYRLVEETFDIRLRSISFFTCTKYYTLKRKKLQYTKKHIVYSCIYVDI